MKNLLLLISFISLFSSCNFHEVDEGKLYRSAQLSGKEFEKAIKKHNIKTIINLRGASPGKDWYEEEKEVAQKYNVHHIDIGMSAQRLPHREDLLKLLNAYQSVERPILIHCRGGADRTGEASAIYQMLYMGKTKKEALKMLTVKYFHLKKRFPAKRYFIKELWVDENWAYQDYFPCENDYLYYDKSRFCQENQSEYPPISEDEDT